MKIKRVSVWTFVRELDGRAWNPAFRWRERRAPLIVVETANGARGIGEAWSRYTDSRSVLDALVSRVAPALMGQTIEHPRGAARKLALAAPAISPEWALSAALSAVDIALWDAYGHEQGKPIWALLGGTTEVAPVYASGGLYRDGYSMDDLSAETRGYIERGFTAVKMKIGGLSPEDDLGRVAAVRRAIGAGNMLWVDAVNQLTVDTATSMCAALHPFDVAAIQAPIPFDDIAGMTRLNRDVMPVIAAESEFKFAAFDSLLRARAVTHLQYCLPLCGGISGACELDDRALAAGVSSTPQCFSTSIVQAATLHFAAARPNVVSAEYHCYHDHMSDLYEGGTGSIRGGKGLAGGAPGLGVRIPEIGVQPDGSVVSNCQNFK